MIVIIIVVVILFLITLIGFYLAGYSMRIPSMTLEQARAWQEAHYDISWYDGLQKTDYTVSSDDDYVLHAQLIQNPTPKSRYIIIENLAKPEIREKYNGPVTTDFYGREVPKRAHGSINLGSYTSSTRQIMAATMELYDRIMNPDLLVRRMYVVCNHVKDEKTVESEKAGAAFQLDMFTDYKALEKQEQAEKAARERERKQQEVVA